VEAILNNDHLLIFETVPTSFGARRGENLVTTGIIVTEIQIYLGVKVYPLTIDKTL
jgi:hypothetical protein